MGEDLPWNDAEELLTDADSVPLNAPLLTVSAPQPAANTALAENVQAFNRLLRTIVLSGTALGLASAAKLPELELKVQGRSPSHLVTLALFLPSCHGFGGLPLRCRCR